MKFYNRIILILVFMILMLSSTTAQARPTKLTIVFWDGLWGAAIGGLAGTAVWSLGNGDSDDFFSPYLTGGMAVGALAGIVYGFYTTPRLIRPYFLMDNGQPKGLVHFSTDTNTVDILPAKILPSYQYGDNVYSPGWRFDLFSTSF